MEGIRPTVRGSVMNLTITTVVVSKAPVIRKSAIYSKPALGLKTHATRKRNLTNIVRRRNEK